MNDFSGVTERPGDEITAHAARMFRSRYEMTRRVFAGTHLLEVGCGTAQGLAYLKASAEVCVGGDVTHQSLAIARRHQPLLPVAQLDAHALPFLAHVFDLVALHESVYYLRDVATVLAEVHRVLRPGGTVLITTVNPMWRDFNPSPQASRYLTAGQLRDCLERQSFERVDIWGGFPDLQAGPRARLLSSLKRLAIRAGLIPGSMRGKRLLKRVFLGRLHTVPPVLTPDFGVFEEPRPVPDDEARCRVIYAIARTATAVS